MKLDPREYELLFEFLNNADGCLMVDKSDNNVLRLENLKRNGLTFSSGNDIMSFNIPNTNFSFPFESYENMSRNVIYFFKKDGYVLEVYNYKNGMEIIKELDDLRK